METDEIVKTLHPFEIKILNQIDPQAFTIATLSQDIDLNEAQTRSGVNWLEGKELIEKDNKSVVQKYTLSKKGESYALTGLLELAIYKYLKENNEVDISHLMENLDYDKRDSGSAFGFLRKNNQIIQEKNGSILASKTFDLQYYEDLTQLLQSFVTQKEINHEDLDSAQAATLSKAMQIQLHKNFFKFKESEIFTYTLTQKGKMIQKILDQKQLTGEEISQITPEILKEKKWKNRQFRQYNINLPAPHILIGKKHPYREFLDFLKYKFVGLGFKEMRGSPVESEFWNMDALFMPQTHPARDIHDVYYIKEPRYAKNIPEPIFTNVAVTHENGGKANSRGWGYKFDRNKSRQLILRSQGTVLSARTLAQKPSVPGKYFSIARCFRYDKVDATHLADFFQVEGIVLSKNANISTLLGLLEIFAKEIARANEIKFTPGYFPFTEPSVEVHIKHPKLGWYELGGSGIFRPEVTRPLGIDVPVLAWGLGVDRMAMMALGFNDIRDLFSRDLDLIRETTMEI